jgi:hypothetical protein
MWAWPMQVEKKREMNEQKDRKKNEKAESRRQKAEAKTERMPWIKMKMKIRLMVKIVIMT